MFCEGRVRAEKMWLPPQACTRRAVTQVTRFGGKPRANHWAHQKHSGGDKSAALQRRYAIDDTDRSQTCLAHGISHMAFVVVACDIRERRTCVLDPREPATFPAALERTVIRPWCYAVPVSNVAAFKVAKSLVNRRVDCLVGKWQRRSREKRRLTEEFWEAVRTPA